MRKTICVILLVFLSLTNALKACGGCVDSPLPNQLMSESTIKFELLEAALATKITEIATKLSLAFNIIEADNFKESAILMSLKSYQALKAKEEQFLIKQNNRLQSLANEIRGTE